MRHSGEPPMVANPAGSDRTGDPSLDDIYETRIVGTPQKLDSVLRSFDLDVGCSHPHFEQIDDQTFALLAFARRPQIEELRSAGYVVEVGENVSRRAESLKNEIGTGDRFDGGRVVPRGFGIKGDRRGVTDDTKRRGD